MARLSTSPSLIRCMIAALLAISLISAGCRRPPDPSTATARSEILTIGDAAPPIEIDQWVVGSPVDSKLSGRVHVVEFWATWCGPCRVSMPHISELQKRYDDQVVFIGVTREDVATVNAFLQQPAPDGRLWSDVIEYRLATDRRDATNAAFMDASGQDSIPTAFVVGKTGEIEWIGNAQNIDQPLAKVLDGTWDRETARKQLVQRRRLREMEGDLRRWMATEDWDSALRELNDIEADTGSSLELSRFKLMILEVSGKHEELSAYLSKMVEDAWEEPMMLDTIAWTIAAADQPRDLDTAHRAAIRAAELTNQDIALILNTVARVRYKQGNLEDAIQWQQKSVEKNNGEIKAIDAALQTYQQEAAAKVNE